LQRRLTAEATSRDERRAGRACTRAISGPSAGPHLARASRVAPPTRGARDAGFPAPRGGSGRLPV